MSKAIPKLGAIAAAACLFATMALPAHAATMPDDPLRMEQADLQTLASSAAAPVGIVRDSYGVTAAPKIVVAPRIVPAAVTAPGRSASVNHFAAVSAPAQAYSGAAILAYASQFVGVVPYGMGNSPTTSFSCDGFTQYVFAGFGISLPRGADHQAALGVRISQGAAVAGDLIWWPGQHIGIYDGAGGMYNSPTWGRFVEHVPRLWGSPVFIRLA